MSDQLLVERTGAICTVTINLRRGGKKLLADGVLVQVFAVR